jgi:hypothetical protein
METIVQLPRMRDNLPALRQLAEMLPKDGLLVEIGSFAGESTRVFLEAGLHVHAIDPWDNAARDRLHEGARDFDPAYRWRFEMSESERALTLCSTPIPIVSRSGKGTSGNLWKSMPMARSMPCISTLSIPMKKRGPRSSGGCQGCGRADSSAATISAITSRA